MISALDSILRRPRTVLTLMLVMILAGAFTYIAIPKEANPDIDVPVFYVSIGQQGISPEDSERLLVRPMETSLRGLDGLKELTAVASEGHAGIVLEFNIDFNKEKALADIRDKVDQAQAELPDDANEPQIFETNFSLQPTIFVALSGNVPERTLFRHARLLQDELESIPTVLEANLNGHREEQLEVIIDMMRLESYDITQQELLTSLSNNNQLVAAGFLDSGRGRFNVKVPGLIETAQDVYSLPIKQNGEGVVTLSDVAEIRRTFKDPSGFTRINGKQAIAISVVKRLGTNIIENNVAVREKVVEFTSEWPDAIQIDFMLDQSNFIKEVQGSLQSSIMTAIVLVMIVVLAALGVRSAILVGLAIPTSFMTGFLILGGLGMTVNMMVMFGLVLTVGMLVDGAIVIVEYADRKISEGMHRREAYIRAAKLMLWPIVSSTGTTLAAFLPLLLWPGVSGEFMSYLPIMVVIVLSAALVTAMIFLPVTGGLIGRNKASQEEAKQAAQMNANADLNIAEMKGITGIYLRFLNRISGSVTGNLITLTVAVAIVVGVFVAFGSNNAGEEFFVEEEPDQAIVLVTGRGNMSILEIDDLVREVEGEILQTVGVRNAVASATAGSGGGGGDAIGGVQDKPADVIGEINIELEDYCCRRKAIDIFDEIRSRTADMAGISVEIRKVEGGPPTGKDLRLEIKSTDYDQLVTAVAQVRSQVETMSDLIEIEDGRPLPGIEWQLDIDREEAGRFNAGIGSVGAMVQLVTNGVMIGTYRPDDSEDEIDIRVRLPENQRSFDELDKLKLRTTNGQVPISNFVTREAVPKVSTITRRDGLYAMDIKANIAPNSGVLPDAKVTELQQWLDEQSWPDTVQMRFRGADEEQKEAGAFLQKAALVSLFLMFIILVTQYNSFYQTAITLMTVILAVVGVLIGLMVTGQKFSIIMTGTGVVALAGIVVNNAIVLIDTYNRLRQEGAPPKEAVLKTSAQRLRPILLTTITTIAGLIPMATQVNFDFFNRVVSVGGITSIWWVQLSTAIIAGLAFSTLLTLLLVPVLLSMPTNFVELYHRLRDKNSDTRETGRRETADIRPFPMRDETTPQERPLPQAAE
ncbi:efflux RND transporter permease subunit [Pararhizobium sp. IMCC21322]|uniref:efflux RND transporter permease subunit n=1 Tax=Pararhizobium sp. IMCC21322 TaxID=3067903 RepID=UPI002741A007|nr:efflux RND transporter permease subunit [Pararhizobium sp. IMCC21322]